MTYLTCIIYMVAGLSIIYFFQSKRSAISQINQSKIPELDDQDYNDLIILLKTAYERTLYMGILFIPLAVSSYGGGDKTGEVFFMVLICLLFISNIIPRNKIINLLKTNNLSIKDLKKRGISL